MTDAVSPERTFHCDVCGFDAPSMADEDLVAALGSFGRRFRTRSPDGWCTTPTTTCSTWAVSLRAARSGHA